ncbi:pectin lyase-like protein [Trichodelitschia bisporula]|uniref:pectinesterase n=1 Tax=Trichodelitschia bisporula TaxID=703511 RepID=A0A6G1HLU8_9PEZI|nr:pectin lyase-like protein [Trichodelitschia bisporula]
MRSTVFSVLLAAASCLAEPTIFPANKATNVNPDTHLILTFPSPPKIGTSGLIRIYDAADKKLVDTLDMSISPSPNPSGRAPNANGQTKQPGPADPNDNSKYQVTMIAGVDFHFFPIIVRNNTATVYPHHGALKYGHSYTVKMDPTVLTPAAGAFSGFTTDTAWTFTTKAASPTNSSRIVVAADGSGDFNTVQGAIDFVPSSSSKRITIFIKNGFYEELVYMKGKNNIIIRGESRDKVIVGYPNNSAFNPPKSGPSRRPAFTITQCKSVQLSSFTINNYFVGQAEALLVRGEKVVLDHMTLSGSGDAFTTYGSIYFADSKLTGHGDTVLGYGAVFYLRSEIHSIGPFTWTRTPAGQHGNVFVNSSLISINEPLPWTVTEARPTGQDSKSTFARLPRNGGPTGVSNFPNAEMVLINVKTSGVPPEGWGPIQSAPFDTSNVHFWEYNTMDLDGKPVDMSKRHPVSKQLKLPTDGKTIADYSNPKFVLGWEPVIVGP